jgi:hypothetical protein
MQPVQLSTEDIVELAQVVQELYPREVERAYAELTIRKQAAEIERLTQENASLKESVVDQSVIEHHGHSHDD